MRGWVLVIAALLPLEASAQTYTVRQGDSLGAIAEKHGIPLSEIVRANRLDNPDHIEPGLELTLSGSEGEVVERGVIHVVRRGVTLGHIASAYGVSKRRLIRANRIRDPNMVREGARILVPRAERVVPIATKVRRPCLRDPVELYRVRTRETRHIVLTRCNGTVWTEGVEELSRFLDRTGAEAPPLLNRRLVSLLQRVSRHFDGRRIEVISAYRAPVGEQRASSRHCKAMAMDFRVKGVPNTRLRDFARTLGAVGVGYYPNSTFVHLDVRERAAFWVDWSGPGEPARYGTLAHDPARGGAVTKRSRRGKRSASAVGGGRRRGTVAAP